MTIHAENGDVYRAVVPGITVNVVQLYRVVGNSTDAASVLIICQDTRRKRLRDRNSLGHPVECITAHLDGTRQPRCPLSGQHNHHATGGGPKRHPITMLVVVGSPRDEVFCAIVAGRDLLMELWSA